jgi:subtilisin family serine protease
MVRNLANPWAPNSQAYSLPGSLLLKVRLGEAPSGVPTGLDVRRSAATPATSFDGGVIDRLVRRHVGTAQIQRVYPAAVSLGSSGGQHHGYDDREQMCGMSRTFRLDFDPGRSVEALADSLNEVSVVEHATPNYLASLPFAAAAVAPDLDVDAAWGPRDSVFAREAMAYEPGDQAVIVAVVDSGVAPHHPELSKRFRHGYDTVHLRGEDFAPGVKLLDPPTGHRNPIDAHVGHGMACAGIIGARGEMIPPGIAGECSMIPIRVLGSAQVPGKPHPVGLGAISDIDMGMKIAVDLGGKVLNMSFGTPDSALPPDAPKPHADVVQYALLRGCVLVAASGNSGAEEAYWPAAFDDVIAVGSVGVNGEPSPFTTRGKHVALCAVGEHVATCALQGYQLATGTSFAAPFVSAAAALLVSHALRRSFPIEAADIKQHLINSATSWPEHAPQGCGAGILNIVAALQSLDRAIDRSPPDENGPDAPNITDDD